MVFVGVVGRDVILCEYNLILSFYSTQPGQASQDLEYYHG